MYLLLLYFKFFRKGFKELCSENMDLWFSSILVFWLGFGAFPTVVINWTQSRLKLFFDEVRIISRSRSSSTMPRRFFAESASLFSASVKPAFVGGTPPVDPIVTVTVTTQFRLHGVAFVMNLVLCFFLLWLVYWRISGALAVRSMYRTTLIKMK